MQQRQNSDPRWRGAFTAVITPFTADGARIDFDRLAAQIALQAAGRVAGIILAGTTGESPTLEPREYEELVRRGIELAHQHKILAVAGTGSNSTAHAVHLQKFAADAGADAALSVNPYYNKPTQAGLFEHFRTVAAAARLPVILYNIPGRTGVAINPDTLKRLADIPNIVAVKDATGNVEMASETCVSCPGLAVLSGDDPLTLPMASVGGVGVISVVSNVVPDRVSALCAAFLDGRWPEALQIHRQLLPLCKALFLETNPIPVKAAMKMLGRDSGALRLPMTPAAQATADRLAAVLEQASVR